MNADTFPTQIKNESVRLFMMKDNREKKEIKDMENKRNDVIDFTDYAPLNREYSKQELADIYKKIIKDIESKR